MLSRMVLILISITVISSLSLASSVNYTFIPLAGLEYAMNINSTGGDQLFVPSINMSATNESLAELKEDALEYFSNAELFEGLEANYNKITENLSDNQIQKIDNLWSEINASSPELQAAMQAVGPSLQELVDGDNIWNASQKQKVIDTFDKAIRILVSEAQEQLVIGQNTTGQT
jgi:cell shape-determining protein MreC